jgi:transcription initiation factor TFIIH subunit 4
MDFVDMLSFFFMLGSLELGQAYSISSLSPTQTQMLDDLSDFGVVYRPSNDSPYFCPTRLATTLTSDAGALLASPSDALSSSAGHGKGYIILETNHRIYAYTSSLLQIAVLNLFTKLTTRFANLVSGKLTKESVQRAISYGITSNQIISYLQTHAHPQMYKPNASVLPPTVVDQIRLWQLERDRMRATGGWLLKEFASYSEYQDIVKYAEALGVLAWKSDDKWLCFVTNLTQMQTYIRTRLGRNGT